MTAGVEGSVDPEDAARDSRRDRRPGVFGDGVPVPAVDQGVRGEDNVGSMSRRLTPFFTQFCRQAARADEACLT